jgi:hypothetical protein
MSTGDELIAIRAEVRRLAELMQVQDQLLASKDAQLPLRQAIE